MKQRKNEKDGRRGEKQRENSRVRRLLYANLLALAALVTATVTVLFCLGLFDSVLASLFGKG